MNSNSKNAIDLEIEQISIGLEMNKYSIGQSVVYVDDFCQIQSKLSLERKVIRSFSTMVHAVVFMK